MESSGNNRLDIIKLRKAMLLLNFDYSVKEHIIPNGYMILIHTENHGLKNIIDR